MTMPSSASVSATALLLARCGLDAKGIAASIVARFGTRLVEAPAASIKPPKLAAEPAVKA